MSFGLFYVGYSLALNLPGYKLGKADRSAGTQSSFSGEFMGSGSLTITTSVSGRPAGDTAPHASDEL